MEQFFRTDQQWYKLKSTRHREQERKLAPDAGKLKAGRYKFILENIMREDPLKEVMNVGIRVEKVK